MSVDPIEWYNLKKQLESLERTEWMFDADQIIPMENLVGL